MAEIKVMVWIDEEDFPELDALLWKQNFFAEWRIETEDDRDGNK